MSFSTRTRHESAAAAWAPPRDAADGADAEGVREAERGEAGGDNPPPPQLPP